MNDPCVTDRFEPNVDFNVFVLGPKSRTMTTCCLSFDAPGTGLDVSINVRGRELRRCHDVWVEQVRIDGAAQLLEPVPLSTFMGETRTRLGVAVVRERVEFDLRNDRIERVVVLLKGVLRSIYDPAASQKS